MKFLKLYLRFLLFTSSQLIIEFAPSESTKKEEDPEKVESELTKLRWPKDRWDQFNDIALPDLTISVVQWTMATIIFSSFTIVSVKCFKLFVAA